mgnify:CR=1 FL=1
MGFGWNSWYVSEGACLGQLRCDGRLGFCTAVICYGVVSFWQCRFRCGGGQNHRLIVTEKIGGVFNRYAVVRAPAIVSMTISLWF